MVLIRDCSINNPIIIEDHFFSGIGLSLFLPGGWVVNFPTLNHFCHVSSLGGGGWVLKEIICFFLSLPYEGRDFAACVKFAEQGGAGRAQYLDGTNFIGSRIKVRIKLAYDENCDETNDPEI